MAGVAAIRFPFGINAAGGRFAEENDHDRYIGQLIRQVLLTTPGERINRPDFGAGLKRLVFAPNSPATASLAQTIVLQALTTSLGTLIRVDDITAEAKDERLDIGIVYTVLAKRQQRFLNVEVSL